MLKVHYPVLHDEVKKCFAGSKINYFVDGTLGAGGHARSIIENVMTEDGVYFGFDQDSDSINIAKENLKDVSGNVVFIHNNFCNLKKELKKHSVVSVGGMLFDLGMSSMQLDSKTRGFAFRFEAPLDMRMDVRNSLTAYDVVNGYDEKELFRVFKEYSDLKHIRSYIRRIINGRKNSSISSTKELADMFKGMGRRKPGRASINPATEVFQAIRIEVNDELASLRKGLTDAFDVLDTDGVMVVISFHSLEDRIVKRFFKEKTVSCRCHDDLFVCACEGKPLAKSLSTKPVMAKEKELNENSRSRSAKLRAIKKYEN